MGGSFTLPDRLESPRTLMRQRSQREGYSKGLKTESAPVRFLQGQNSVSSHIPIRQTLLKRNKGRSPSPLKTAATPFPVFSL